MFPPDGNIPNEAVIFSQAWNILKGLATFLRPGTFPKGVGIFPPDSDIPNETVERVQCPS